MEKRFCALVSEEGSEGEEKAWGAAFYKKEKSFLQKRLFSLKKRKKRRSRQPRSVFPFLFGEEGRLSSQKMGKRRNSNLQYHYLRGGSLSINSREEEEKKPLPPPICVEKGEKGKEKKKKTIFSWEWKKKGFLPFARKKRGATLEPNQSTEGGGREGTDPLSSSHSLRRGGGNADYIFHPVRKKEKGENPLRAEPFHQLNLPGRKKKKGWRSSVSFRHSSKKGGREGGDRVSPKNPGVATPLNCERRKKKRNPHGRSEAEKKEGSIVRLFVIRRERKRERRELPRFEK